MTSCLFALRSQRGGAFTSQRAIKKVKWPTPALKPFKEIHFYVGGRKHEGDDSRVKVRSSSAEVVLFAMQQFKPA